MDILYVDNDHVVEIQGLRDQAGALVSGAVAQATLYQADGVTEVPGVAWPLALTYTGTRGIYRGELGNAVEVVDGNRYEMKLSAEYVGKRFDVTRTVKAKTRYG